jgi:hypothetical protein
VPLRQQLTAVKQLRFPLPVVVEILTPGIPMLLELML